MKTLSFHELGVGRSPHQLLLELDTATDGMELRPGLSLIVAPNGYGKTTFLQTLAGVLPKQRGEARWEGKSLSPELRVLYVSEYLTFPKFIYPPEWIEFMSGAPAGPELDRWIDGFSLRKKMGSYLGRMSQGERRKVTWLGAHASKKPILLLDEPLDGLDLLAIKSAREMVQTWRDEGRLVLVVAHQVGELLDLSDQVLLIREKKLLAWKSLHSNAPHEIKPEDFRQKVLEFYAPR
jgi:ABC-type multidrug transport system ATPase subunit